MKYYTLICSALFLIGSLPALLGQSTDCELITNGIDLQTKSFRIEIAPDLLFNHTPPEIKNDLQSRNLIQCKGQVVKVDDKAALHLNLRVNSQKAREVYGTVNKGYIMKIVLIDGKEVQLTCFAGSKGVLSPERNGYIYPLGFELSNKAIRSLSKKEIDKIGIQWSSGYEEYTIYEVDFLMNQIACLQRASQKSPN